MLLRMVSLNRMTSWVTTAIWERRSRKAALAQIHPADADGAGGGIVKAQEQVGQGGLARAGAADQRDHLARLDFQLDVAQDHFGAVAEADVVKMNFSAGGAKGDGLGGVW